MPEAHAILAFLSTFLALWGISLIGRGLIGNRSRAARRCPSCGQSMSDHPGLACHHCTYEARTERQLRRPVRNWMMVGAGLVAGILAVACGSAAAMVFAWTHYDPDLPIGAGTWSAAAAALALFWVCILVWAFRGEPSRGRRRCPSCWYDLGGGGLTCSECGHKVEHSSQLFQSRRRKRWILLAVLGLLTAPPVHYWPIYRSSGPVALVPTTVLIAGLPWWPDSFIRSSTRTDRTLLRRFHYQELSPWQQRWLKLRAHQTLNSTNRADGITRAMSFLPDALDPHARSLLRVRLTRSLLSSDSAIASDAAEALLAHPALFASGSPYGRSAIAVDDIMPWLPQLVELSASDNLRVALAACALLASSSEHVSAAVQQSVAIGISSGGATRWTIPGVLRVAGSTEEGLTAIRQLYRSEDAVVRMMAIRGTPFLARGCEDFQTEMTALLLDPDSRVALATADCLRNHNPDPVLAPLVLAFHQAPTKAQRDLLYSWVPMMHHRDLADERLSEAMYQLLTDTDPELRAAVIDLLQTREVAGEDETMLESMFLRVDAEPDRPTAEKARLALEAIRKSGDGSMSPSDRP